MRNNNNTRRQLFSQICAAAIGLGLCATASAKQTIGIGQLSWDGALGIQSVLQVVMERHLDVEVEIVQADQAVMMKSMDKGKGGIDVHPDLWMPSHNDKWVKFIASGSRETVRVNQQPYRGQNGFFIPGYIQDQHKIHSVSDLLDPKVAELFDNDGDGKGDFWPGAPGWNGANVHQVKAKSYGFDKNFKAFHVSDPIFKAQLKNAYRKKKGLLFFGWTPDWIHNQYDLRMLEEPAFDGYAMPSKQQDPLYKPGGCWNMYQPKEAEDWLEKSSIQCAWPAAKVYVAYSSSLEQRAPKVASFLSQVSFDPSDIGQWILQIGKEKQDPVEVAEQWVDANPDKVQQWLGDN